MPPRPVLTASRILRIAARPIRAAAVARARQNHIELALEHGLQEFARPIA